MKYFTFIALALLFTSCSAMSWVNQKLGLEDDNIVEELAEDVIELETKWEVDLTPSTPEKK